MVRLAPLVIVSILALGSSSCMMDAFQNKKLEGSFSSTNEKLGDWTLAPSSCVHGKERGFEGIAFGFDGGKVKEIRLDSAVEGNNLIEVHMADKAGTVYRALEPECENISGEINQSNVTINDRHMFRLTGYIEFQCSKDGLRGRADFEGCLPQTL
jgi:hypothetical protein